MSSFAALEGTFTVLVGADEVPVGAWVPGDCRRFEGQVVRLWKPDRSRKTIHLVTSASYEEGRTLLSFVPTRG